MAQQNQAQRKITISVVGMGNRGQIYSEYAHERPELCELVAFAEPRQAVRDYYAKYHNVPVQNVFSDWRELAAQKRLSDAVVITTQDRMHAEPAIALANKGYHILLEKPMAVTEADCRAIVEAVKRNNVILAIGHVLRYTPYSQAIKHIVDSGRLGRIINIQHLEPVGFWHFAHSYVRGPWRNENEATFSLMAKSCHDLDWIRWIMGSKCVRVSSFGSLQHFTLRSKPPGAADRCVFCPSEIESSCPYSALKIYLEPFKKNNHYFPVRHIMPDPNNITEEGILHELKTGPFGRDLVLMFHNTKDNQVVNLEFANGATATFTMIAFSEEVCVRKTRIFGTHGELTGNGRTIKVFDFRTLKKEKMVPTIPNIKTKMTGHFMGDYRLMEAFVEAVAFNDPSRIKTGPEETLESHLIVFQAEKSRKQNQILSCDW